MPRDTGTRPVQRDVEDGAFEPLLTDMYLYVLSPLGAYRDMQRSMISDAWEMSTFPTNTVQPRMPANCVRRGVGFEYSRETPAAAGIPELPVVTAPTRKHSRRNKYHRQTAFQKPRGRK
jgi:hypothetical protein